MILDGVFGFFKTFAILGIILEISLLIEEFFKTKIELRKGFSGTNVTVAKTAERHILRMLRLEGSLKKNLLASLGCVFILTLAGLLPAWDGKIPLDVTHSIWIYLCARILLPVLTLIFEWRFNDGRGWPSFLVGAERAIGSATIMFVLALALVEMTGADSFSALRDLQQEHSILIFRYPLAIIIMFGFIVINLFVSSQSLFGQYITGEKQEGWNLDDFMPQLRRVSWNLFVVDIFLGGAGELSILGDVFLIIKCVFITVLSSFFAQLFIRLREDQAENFILWRMAPISIGVLAISLLLSGGHL